jgi:hypothetical protein
MTMGCLLDFSVYLESSSLLLEHIHRVEVMLDNILIVNFNLLLEQVVTSR